MVHYINYQMKVTVEDSRVIIGTTMKNFSSLIFSAFSFNFLLSRVLENLIVILNRSLHGL